jgi:hypothetical protein
LTLRTSRILSGRRVATSARQVSAPERDGVKEAQRRHRAIDGAGVGAALALVDLEITQILRRCHIGRAAGVGRETPHVPDFPVRCT